MAKRRRDYRQEYQRRQQLGRMRGLDPQTAVGHRRRARRPEPIAWSDIDLRIRGAWARLRDALFTDGTDLADIGRPTVSTQGEPTGQDHVLVFFSDTGATAIYPDGRRDSGAIDDIWHGAVDSGLPITTSSDQPPAIEWDTARVNPAGAVHYLVPGSDDETLCNRRAPIPTDEPATCPVCIRRARQWEDG